MQQRERDSAEQAVSPCPVCGQHHSLVVLGTRLDRTNPWMIWHTTRTVIYACLHCEAIVSMQEPRGHGARAAEQTAPVAVIAEPGLQAVAR